MEEIQDIKSLVQRLKDEQVYVEVRKKREIEKHYGKRRLSQALSRLFELFCKYEFMNFVVTLELQDQRISWCEGFTVFANLNFNPETNAFEESIQATCLRAIG